MRTAMEEVILPEREERRWRCLMEELRKVSHIAMPMVAVTIMQYLLQVVSVMMVGHLGQLSLSSVAIATSLTNVTGFSLLSGLVGGLETLCGQAYGAQQYRKLGNYTFSAIISLILTCFPVCVFWIFMDKLLILMGQDHSISAEARKYSIWLIPALFGGAILKPLVRFLQSQSMILPMLVSSFVVLCFHIPVSWALIFKLELGSTGAAVAISLCTWVNIILLGVYIKYSAGCKNTPMVLSKDSFLCIGEFFRLAVPSAVMVCLKWWSLEVLVLLSGLLPNSKLETSVLSICLTISTLHFTVPYGIGAAASTRVSNELGAGNAKAAQMAVWAVMLITVTETTIVSLSLFCSRYVLGHAYSSEQQVVDYIAVMAPWICLSVVTDSLQAVISGIARGSGWQHIGAYVNLGSFYLVGIPVAVSLGFVLHLRAKGLWIGIVVGSTVQSTTLSLITGVTNWQKQATKARERILKERSEGRPSSV
ncbi:protein DETOXIFICATION 12-like [Diospyros lotus]|uniref:protein DETOXIFICATION 12-like n=1 Tax=Diospyros lotus TaxID=55363 RepID=UPI00225282F2|nr:protein DETOXIFICATION 12-like [Diospyros lotus]